MCSHREGKHRVGTKACSMTMMMMMMMMTTTMVIGVSFLTITGDNTKIKANIKNHREGKHRVAWSMMTTMMMMGCIDTL